MTLTALAAVLSCWFVFMRPAAAPFDPLRVVEAMLGVVDARPPEKFDQAVVVADETNDLIIDRDRPTSGKGEAVDNYRGTHPSRLVHGDVRRTRPSCGGSGPGGKLMEVAVPMSPGGGLDRHR